MTKINWKEPALKFLKSINKNDSSRIVKKIDLEVKENPRRYLKTLVGLDFYKIRVGNYRIFADYNKSLDELTILTIKHRRDAYK